MVVWRSKLFILAITFINNFKRGFVLKIKTLQVIFDPDTSLCTQFNPKKKKWKISIIEWITYKYKSVSNFFFCHYVFKTPGRLLQMRQKAAIWEKGVNIVIFMLSSRLLQICWMWEMVKALFKLCLGHFRGGD